MEKKLEPLFIIKKYLKKKCRYKEKCRKKKYCKFSHKEEEEFNEVKIPTIKVDKSIWTQEFTDTIYIPEADSKLGSNIWKIIIKEGTGKTPKKLSKCTFRSYGITFNGVENEGVEVFSENILQRRVLKINMIDGSISKNPKFYHFILNTMKEGERSIFKVHPKFFDNHSQIKERHSVPEILKGIGKNLFPKDFVYYYFSLDLLEPPKAAENEKRRKKLNFNNFQEAYDYVVNKMKECQNLKSKIDANVKLKTKEFDDNYKQENYKKVVTEYNKIKSIMDSNTLFNPPKFAVNPTIIKEKEKVNTLYCSINLRIANIYLLRRDYYNSEKFAKRAKEYQRRFNCYYYEIVSCRQRNMNERAYYILTELVQLIKKKAIIVSETNKKRLNNEKKYLKKEKLKANQRRKNFAKNLGKSYKRGFLYDGIEKEIEDQRERELREVENKMYEENEKNNIKPWFTNDGQVIYVNKDLDPFEPQNNNKNKDYKEVFEDKDIQKENENYFKNSNIAQDNFYNNKNKNVSNSSIQNFKKQARVMEEIFEDDDVQKEHDERKKQ